MRLSVIVTLMAVPFLTVACGERDRGEVSRGAEKAVDAAEIAKRPNEFYGRPVTVVAEVDSVHGPNAFTFDENDVLVIVPNAARPVEENQEVTVHGMVRPFVIAELQRDYGWFNPSAYEPELLALFRQRPVIIADSVRDERRGVVIAGAEKRPMPVAPGEPGRAKRPPAENEPPAPVD
jgi:hypothetical protein